MNFHVAVGVGVDVDVQMPDCVSVDGCDVLTGMRFQCVGLVFACIWSFWGGGRCWKSDP